MDRPRIHWSKIIVTASCLAMAGCSSFNRHSSSAGPKTPAPQSNSALQGQRSGYPNGGYQNGGYQNPNYQSGYRGTGYQNDQYQGGQRTAQLDRNYPGV